ncbi:MAG: PKD domain-containing protein [Pirellulales bacterium]
MPASVVLSVGDTLAVAGSFTDDDSTQWTASVDYGDGGGFEPLALEQDGSFNLAHQYNAAASVPYSVRVRIVDGGGRSSERVMSVAVQGTGPVVQFNQFSITSIVNEGGEVSLKGAFTDNDLTVSHEVSVEWGDGSSSSFTTAAGVQSFTTTHVYVDDGDVNASTATPRDSYRVAVTVIDPAHRRDTTPDGLYIVEVDNVKPTAITLTGLPSVIQEGSVVQFGGTFFDPGLRDSHTIVVDWGDGSPVQTVLLPSSLGQTSTRSFSVPPHLYRNNPTAPQTAYNVRVSVGDDDEPATPTTVSRSLTVANVAPTFSSIVLSPTTIVEGGSAALDILFADPGENDSHEILVNWGDGSPEESYQRPVGVNTLTLPGHRYADNRPTNASIPVTVRLRDTDMPAGVYVSAVRNLTVTNVAPTLSALQLYARTSGGQWTALPVGAHIAENTQLRMLGYVTDPGNSDVLAVDVAWGSGLHQAADVDSGDGTFEAQFTITDDFGVGTAFDLMTLHVTASDGDGGASSATVDIQVDNTAPTVTVLPDRVVDPQLIPLMSIVDEPSPEDRANLHYDWRAEGSAGTQIGHDAGFTLDRNLVGPGVIRVTLVVSDDDLGSATFTSAMMFGTQNADQLVIDDSTFASANVSSIMVLSLAGSDIIDGTGVTNPAYSLILDGGNDTDLLYGGAGNDTFLLRGGNDSANVPGSVVPTPNEAGNDRYLLVPNSVLTVYDNSGDNSLDFSLANFNLSSQPTLGVTFDLSLVSPTLAVQQDVAPTPGTADTHFVTARGSFSDLIGSFFNDTLTTASGATVDAGAGSDRLVVKSGTIGGSISGGADTDTFSIIGTGISGISFEGDDGADVFQVASGSSISNIDFGGGADTDTFTISAASLIGISFEGDSGADVFDVEPGAVLTGISFGGGADDDVFNVGGAVLAEVSFEGDSGADVFTVGTTTSLSGISFSGGADNDVFVIPSGSTLSGISFEGDSGSDVFQVSTGVGLSGIFFGGGADDDTFTIADGVSLINISFEGDSGADDLIVSGTVLGGISFNGGADDDVFTVGTTSSLGGISFEGDSGADDLIVLGNITGGIEFGGGADTDVLQIGGTVLGTIDFSGGADKDVFTVGTGAEIGGISFEGDSGADELIVGGLLTGGIYFGGGADDDVLSIGGTVIGNIEFGGGADSDVFQVSGSGEVGSISFEGDSGADDLVVLGNVTGGVYFGGGADDDVFAVGGTVIGGIEFSGGADDDVFSVTGTVSGGITFGGGADDDVFSAGGIITGSISFEGDTGNDSLLIRGTASAVAFIGDSGADVFSVTGSVGSIEFGGGADDDVLSISGTVIGNIEFSGGADDDVFSSTGSVGSISFEGDSGADDLLVAGSVGTIEFNGGADSDTLVNRASGVTWIRFSGFGAGATGTDDKDVFVNLGSEIGEISFEGDAGADVFVSLGSDLAKIEFGGGADNDVFVVDGTSIGGIFFEGGADDDVLSVSGTSIGTISFEGDDGSGPGGAADTFVNRSSGALDSNGAPIGTIVFNGYAGNDAFRNDGATWKSVTYTGGGDNDVFQNNGSSLLLIDFEGDSGADVFENNGTSIGQIEFFGGADKDVFASDSSQISQIVFYGGADSDLLINSGSQIAAIDFAGAEGSDTLFNSGTEVDRIAFQGDAGDDRLLNSGASVSNVSFYGGAGSDWFYNRSTAVNASGLSMYAGGTMMQPTLSQFGSEVLLNQPISNAGSIDDADDFFLNEASSISGIYFEGGADDDVFQSSGTNVSGISFEGDAGNDQLLNTGADVIGLLFNGGTGNDSLELRGLRVDGVMFDGGDDADTLISRGADAGEIRFSGGAGIDTWANWGAGARLLDMSGGTEGDRFQNNGSHVESILFTGGDGDDALQQNGDSIGSVIMFGNDGADTLFNNGSDISSIALTGGNGADTLVNSGNRIGAGSTGYVNHRGLWMQGEDGPDLLRTSGTDVVSITFFGDAGEDALLVNSSGRSVSFDGGDDSDVLTLRGTIESAEAFGGDGDDRLVVAGNALVGASLGTVVLHGGAGNDRYEFIGAPQGKYLLDEPSSSSTDTSDDGIDFSSYTAGAVNLDLAVVSPQSLSAGLILQLSSTSVNAIESVIGSSFADMVYGNDRNNYLAGAEFYTGSMPAVAAEKSETQWVLLDFDSATDGFEHVYSLEERQAIVRRLETTYYGLRPDGSTRSFFDSDRWFNIRFALSASELPSSTTPTVLVFNETPSTGRPGGESSEIDPGNLSMSGRAVIQVNGLLGGIEAAPKGDFMLQIPEDGEQNYGNVKPPATVDNFIALSSKIAAHELAHMLGLRHYDAFGPIGFGIHSPPGAASFKPEYQGSSAAFETFDHIIGSPASVGSSRFNDIGNLFFGEREAVKLAYGMSDTSQTTLVESSLTTAHNTFAAAAVLPVVTLNVPNTLSSGLNSDKSFYVQAAAVIGSIGLDSTGHSENDYYRFSGRRGDLVTIEVSSQSLRRYLNLGLSGTIDSVVRLRYADGRIVSFAGRDAVNDDEFESSDSLLMDVELPETGDYIIEVDTFSRGPRSTDPTPEQLALLSPEARQLLADTLNDTDTGNYQLFVYNFAKANAVSALDTLVGRDGVDVIELGGSFASGPLIDSYSSTQSSIVNQAFTTQMTFSDDGGNLWTATVDYGDGNAPITMTVTPTGGIPLNAVYSSVGTKSVHVIVTNDDGVTAEASITVNVVAATPVPVIESISDNALEGNVITVVGSASQEGLSGAITLTWTITRVVGSDSIPVSNGSGTSYSFTAPDDGVYNIVLTATNNSGVAASVSQLLNVANLAPVPTIATVSSPLQEGTSITATGSATDAGVNDSPSLAWSVYVVTGAGSTLVSSGSGATFTFTPADNGTYRIDLTATDKDGASATVSRTLNVANLAPVPTIVTVSSPLQEGTSITATGSATDAGVNDSPSLAWSVYVVTGAGSTLVSSGSGATFAFTPADNGTYRIDLTATDKDGASGTVSRTVNVANVTPSASLTLNVGSTVTVGTPITATISASDPAGVNDPLAYSWVITKDGFAYATQTGGTTYTFTPSAAGSYVLSVTVNDGDGGLVTATSTVTVAPVTSGNTPPTVAITTPVNGVFKETSWLRFTATDVDVVDQNGTFKYVINWGDGLSETVFAGRSLLRGHVYDRVSSSGSFTVSATATDARGATGPTAAVEFVVTGWTLMPDPINGGKAILVIVGSQQDDNIKVKTKDDDYYQVTIVDRDNDVRRKGTIYGDVDRILVFAQDGNDHVMLDDDIDIPAEVWGGAGDDDIKGGSGNDILLGESGNDNLWGGDGRDIVIGGNGADRIHGDANDDILIAGFTAFEAEFNRSAPSAFAASSRLTFEQQRSALEAVMAEWASNRSVTSRRQNILGVGTGTRANGNTFFRTSDSVMTNNTVFDDNEVDKLWGDDGTDWFFANIDPVRGGVLDDIKERKGSEFIEDLDKWW